MSELGLIRENGGDTYYIRSLQQAFYVRMKQLANSLEQSGKL